MSAEQEFREALYPKIENQYPELVRYCRSIDDTLKDVDVLTSDCMVLSERAAHSIDDRELRDIATAMAKEALGCAKVQVDALSVAASAQPTAPKRTKAKRKSVYIYLMLNKRNLYTKIGYSSNPIAREATLQSEEPEVELLFKAIRPKKLERELHREFASYRVRGEWFNLPESLRDALIKRLSN